MDSYTGRDSNDKFGWDVAISGDRSIIAAGAPYGNNAGYVMIFSKLDTDWGVLQQINGTNANENFGSSIGLSYDGSILSIVSEGSKVGFYELSSSKTFYDLLDSRNFNGAGNVAVSPNGKVAGITSNTGNGRARIFERSNNDRFLPKGQITNALGFEGGISLNYDGSIFIIGDISSSSVRVYQYNNNRWDVKGNEITDDSGFDDFGCCVSITHDGLTVAIGAPGNYENEGLVRVHYYNETEQTWIVSGDDLLGDNNGDGFSRNSLSATGKYLVVGTYAGNYVKIFERNGVNYQPLGEKLTQESESFGWSVDISADGSAVVVGSPTFSDDKGKGYLFLSDISQSTPSPSVSPSLVPTTTASEILNPSDIPQATPSLISTIQNPSDIPQATPSPSVSSSLVPTTTASEIQNPSDIPQTTLFPSVSSSLIPTTTASKIQHTDIPQATPSSSVSSSLVPTATSSKIQNPSNIPQTALFPSVSSSLVPTTTASKIQNADILQVRPPTPSVSTTLVPTTTPSKIRFDLTFVGEETVVDFSGDSPADEIVMKTLVSKNDQRDSFQQKIMIGAECQYNLSFEYPDIIPPVTVSNDQSLDEDWRGDTIKVTTKIDIDTENIVTNGIHSSDPNNKSIYSEYLDPTDGRLKAKITFCVRTDYGRIDIIGGTGESSITFYKVKVTINFPLEYGFSSADVSIEEEEESNVEQVGTITANLEACACPADAVSKTNCTDSTSYDQNDILNVCVYDPNNNAIITAFKDVSLGNGEISTQVVDSTGNPSALASVNKLNEEMAMINTRIVSAFFDVVDESTGSPMPVTVAGTAVIGFKTVNRKIIAISTRGVKNMRKLQDNSDTDVVRGEGSFDIKVLLSDGGQLDGSPGPAQVSEYGKMLFVTLMMISTSLSGLLE